MKDEEFKVLDLLKETEEKLNFMEKKIDTIKEEVSKNSNMLYKILEKLEKLENFVIKSTVEKEEKIELLEKRTNSINEKIENILNVIERTLEKNMEQQVEKGKDINISPHL